MLEIGEMMKNKKSEDQNIHSAKPEKNKSAPKVKDTTRDQLKKKELKPAKEKKSEKLSKPKKITRGKSSALHPWYDLSNAEVAATGTDMLQVCYEFFDQLIQDFPQYVSRQVLGYEETGLEIREYWIQPRLIGKMRIASKDINHRPTLLMISGQHGQEYTSIINLMLMLHDLFYQTKQHPTLSLLHATYHLRIIPCLNPWGVANENRRNARNVDLNRNFSVGWQQAQGNKGEVALSEIESRILLDWVKRHKSETTCLLNLHDHSDLAVSWGAASHEMTQKILLHAFQHFSVWYQQHFNDPNPEIPLTWLGIPRAGYSDKHIAEVLQVPTLLFECPYIGHARISEQWRDVRQVSQQILRLILERLLNRYYNQS